MFETSEDLVLRSKLSADFGRRGNESLQSEMSLAERGAMISDAEKKVEELLTILRVDIRNDPHTLGTPRRVAKMFVTELLRGRFTEPPEVTEFEKVSNRGEMIITGPIHVRSTCAHHLLPIYGDAFIGVIPSKSGNVVGLSKYDRIVSYFSARLQVQEELVEQIGSFIMEQTKPSGLAVRISAIHACKTHRGVYGSRESRMVTSEFFGNMSGNSAAKAEFARECLALGTKD